MLGTIKPLSTYLMIPDRPSFQDFIAKNHLHRLILRQPRPQERSIFSSMPCCRCTRAIKYVQYLLLKGQIFLWCLSGVYISTVAALRIPTNPEEPVKPRFFDTCSRGQRHRTTTTCESRFWHTFCLLKLPNSFLRLRFTICCLETP
jgi:hypothetical protein